MDEATVTTITTAVDFSTIITGIGSIAAAVAGVLIAVKGAKLLLSAIRGS